MALKVNDTTIISKIKGVSSASEEDDSLHFNNLLKEEYGLNLDLYPFNMKNKFNNGKKTILNYLKPLSIFLTSQINICLLQFNIILAKLDA